MIFSKFFYLQIVMNECYNHHFGLNKDEDDHIDLNKDKDDKHQYQYSLVFGSCINIPEKPGLCTHLSTTICSFTRSI